MIPKTPASNRSSNEDPGTRNAKRTSHGRRAASQNGADTPFRLLAISGLHLSDTRLYGVLLRGRRRRLIARGEPIVKISTRDPEGSPSRSSSQQTPVPSLKPVIDRLTPLWLFGSQVFLDRFRTMLFCFLAGIDLIMNAERTDETIHTALSDRFAAKSDRELSRRASVRLILVLGRFV